MTTEKKARTDNRRLAQWRVSWLIEHSTSYQLLWCIESFVFRNPPHCLLRERQQKPPITCNQTLINHKCVCGALNRHFWQTLVCALHEQCTHHRRSVKMSNLQILLKIPIVRG